MSDENKKIKNRRVILILLVYMMILIFFHLFGYELYGDDATILQTMSPTRQEDVFRKENTYADWSSRFIINPLIYFLSHFNVRVWAICNIVLMTVGLYCVLSDCGVKTDRKGWLVLAVVLMFPFEIAIDVGWLVTSVTYVWPLVAGLLACFTIKDFLCADTRCNRLAVPICLATIFAANKEELSVTLAIIFLYILILSVKRRQAAPLIYAQFGISVLSVGYHLCSKGNNMRYTTSLNAADLSFMDKICMGFISTLHHLFFSRNYLFTCFCILLFLLCMILHVKKYVKVLSAFPLALTCIAWLTDVVPASLRQYRSWRETDLVAPVVLAVLGIACILISLYAIIGQSEQYMLCVVCLAAGFAGRMTIGFSGKGFDEFERTYTFLYYIIIMVMARLVVDCEKKINSETRKKIIRSAVTAMAVIGVVRTIFEIGIL